MKNYWFSSDPHYFHKNILKFTKRPFSSIEDMNEAFVEWNNVNVKNTDIVWNLGDFSFGSLAQTKSILSRLKGEQHLVLGNHCFNISKAKNEIMREGLLQSIQHYKEIRIDKQKIMLMHYPMRAWNCSNRGSIQLFGHVHGSLPPFGKSVDVGIDSEWITGKYEGRPFHLDEILEFMKDRHIEKDYLHE